VNLIRWRGRALGLDIDAPTTIVGVPRVADQGPRCATVDFLSLNEFDQLWEPARPARLFQRVFSDGTPMLTVDHDGELGYRVWAPEHGRHLVANDGQTVLSARPTRGWWWQRLLLAQVLPIAATLQGIELLHASAVAFDERAVAITATAGSGKTSLAAHLLDLGGEVIADDVLALEIAAGRVVAHPGVALVNIDAEQRGSLGPRAARLLSEAPGQGETTYVLAPIVDRPRSLAAIYVLRRRREVTSLRILDIGGDPRPLLGSSFLSYLESPARLKTHLEICGRIAESVPTFVLEAPLNTPALELAHRLRAHGEGVW
jgi:hypothetical protein